MEINQEKLEVLKTWLTENGYKYKENVEFAGQQADFIVDYPRIAVHVGESDEFFRKVKYKAVPFFIRDSETVEFVIEKMTNCISQAVESKRKRDEERKVKEVEKEKARLAELERQVEEQRKKVDELQKALHKRKRARISRSEKVTSA